MNQLPLNSVQAFAETAAQKSLPQYEIKCVKCFEIFNEKDTVTNCLKCGGALDVVYMNQALVEDFKKQGNLDDLFTALPVFNFIHKVGYLPLRAVPSVSLGEGNTPLIRAKALGKKYKLSNFYLKFEGANPTGVFKDRGSAVEMSKALELGAKAVSCASTGNMAASVAAYCAKAKIPCYVVIPEKTPMGKLAQALAYGASILKVRGDYSDCVRLSTEMAKEYGYYLAGDYVFRSEGQKSLAYELVKQLNGIAPDWVMVPVGCGTNLSAIYKGFVELKELGLIEKVPRFLGVQPDNVPTIVEAWRQKLNHYVPVERVSSVASAVGIGNPLDDVKVLQALYASNGYAESATEEAILDAQQLMGNVQSLFVEPSSALPVAVLPKLLEKKIINSDEIIVAVVTGNGLKDPQSILAADVHSPVLEPSMDELKRYFAMGLTNERRVSLADEKDEVVWDKLPSIVKLHNDLKKMFGVNLSQSSTENLYSLFQAFKAKDKSIRKGDVEYGLETILKLPEGMQRKLEIKDFSVHTTQHQAAEAWVALMFGNELIASHAKGVGPVDAIISAISEAMRTKDTIGAKLTYYNVEINTQGTDAVVEVHLSLKGNNGQEVTGEAASPDVIVASIKAFENAYNLLNWKIIQKEQRS